MQKSTRGQRQFKKICQERKNKGFTQRQLATLIKVVPSHITHYLQGYRRPTLDIAVRIEELFGIAPRDWLKK